MIHFIKNIFTEPQLMASSKRWSRWQLVKAILLLGIPLIIGELGAIAQQFADTMMVGHYGTNELAAAGFVNSIFYFIIFLTLGISYASTPLIGSAFGRKDYKSVFRIFVESTIINLLVGIFFVALLLLVYFNVEFLFFNPHSDLFHQPYEILEISKEYMMYLIISVPFLTLFYACKQYLDGIGNTQVSMWILLFSNLLNIALNWCLIFGYYNFPELGLSGAGLSTLISRIVQLGVMLWVVYKSRTIQSHLTDVVEEDLKPTKKGIVAQFKLGLPISLQLGLEIGTFNICGIFMGWLGTASLAAHQTMYTISTLCFQVLYGIGAAGTILISQFYGIKSWDNIRKTASTTFFVGLFSVIAITAGIYLFFDSLASCFTNDSEVIKLMWCILPSFVLYQFGDCMQITYSNALRGIEETRPLAWIAFFAYICVCIPLCYALAFTFNNGISGVWAGIPIGLSLTGILFWLKFGAKLRKLSS